MQKILTIILCSIFLTGCQSMSLLHLNSIGVTLLGIERHTHTHTHTKEIQSNESTSSTVHDDPIDNSNPILRSRKGNNK